MKASPEVCDDSDGSEDAVCITPARRFEQRIRRRRKEELDPDEGGCPGVVPGAPQNPSAEVTRAEFSSRSAGVGVDQRQMQPKRDARVRRVGS